MRNHIHMQIIGIRPTQDGRAGWFIREFDLKGNPEIGKRSAPAYKNTYVEPQLVRPPVQKDAQFKMTNGRSGCFKD